MNEFHIHVNGNQVPATERFWHWMNNVTVYRGCESQDWASLQLPQDAGVISFHLLTYFAIKYPEKQLVGKHASSFGGRAFGCIGIQRDGDDVYLIYKSARTGKQEQVLFKCDKTGQRFCSLRAMNAFTKKLTSPTLIKDSFGLATITKGVPVVQGAAL